MIRTVFTAVGLAALAFGVAAPAFAGSYRLINTQTNYTIASPDLDRAGTVSFFNLPEGRYQIAIDATKLTKPMIVKVQAGRDAPVTSAPVLPAGRRSTEGPMGIVLSNAAGAPLTFVVPPGSGAPRGAKPEAVVGPAPRHANPLSTIVVTLEYPPPTSGTDETSPAAPRP